ncbi:shikimate dehydrogenase [Candidatus Peregrinibacteria bacterium]|jgi:shikimate dehydrogenase|nr:shikimate dehydrogenase [Candidatus Peregrinibacteria bacterium]MBT7736324.1 shikimate dehydrogenase [Candidatus Peregrinibacteria bacterium]
MKKYGILANPAKHSLSPVMFNAAFKEMEIDAEYRLFEIDELGLSDFIENVKHDPISGLSVSLPHKESVMDYLNEVDEEARAIGAVNTVHNKGGFLYGYNTDHVGSNRALEEACGSLDGKRVVVMGAGGAVRGLVYGLKKAGAEVSVHNRTAERAEAIGKDFDVEFGNLEEMKAASGDVFIQASSLWLNYPEMGELDINRLFPDEFVNKFSYVMDIVYKPLKTPLLAKAEKLGKSIITGDKMLLYQAVEQFKIWTGKEAPLDAMQRALENGLT